MYLIPNIGYLPIVRYMVEKQGIESAKSILSSAMRMKEFDDVKYMHETWNIAFEDQDLSLAVNNFEDVEMVRYVYDRIPSKSTPSNIRIANMQPYVKSVAVLRYVLENGLEGYASKALQGMAHLGNHEGVLYILNNYPEVSEKPETLIKAFEIAMEHSGNLEVLKVLSTRVKLNSTSIGVKERALERGHFEAARMLNQVYGEDPKTIPEYAANTALRVACRIGCLESLSVLFQYENVQCTSRELSYVLSSHFYKVLRFLLKKESEKATTTGQDFEKEVLKAICQAVNDQNLNGLEILAPYHPDFCDMDLRNLDLFRETTEGCDRSVTWIRLKKMLDGREKDAVVNGYIWLTLSSLDCFERELDNLKQSMRVLL
jgi:hypothetical protein